MDKFLIVGLGNPGPEYHETRHNAGWMVVDRLAEELGATFADKRYGFVAETSIKGRKLFLLKPTTYMNLSGNAVRYWLEKENIATERLLVVVDELALPLGKMRLKGSGSNGRAQRTGAHTATHRTEVRPTAHRHRQRVQPWRTGGLRPWQIPCRRARDS